MARSSSVARARIRRRSTTTPSMTSKHRRSHSHDIRSTGPPHRRRRDRVQPPGQLAPPNLCPAGLDRPVHLAPPPRARCRAPRFAQQIAVGVAEWLPDYAAQVDDGSFATAACAIETDARAMAHLINEGRKHAFARGIGVTEVGPSDHQGLREEPARGVPQARVATGAAVSCLRAAQHRVSVRPSRRSRIG